MGTRQKIILCDCYERRNGSGGNSGVIMVYRQACHREWQSSALHKSPISLQVIIIWWISPTVFSRMSLSHQLHNLFNHSSKQQTHHHRINVLSWLFSFLPSSPLTRGQAAADFPLILSSALCSEVSPPPSQNPPRSTHRPYWVAFSSEFSCLQSSENRLVLLTWWDWEWFVTLSDLWEVGRCGGNRHPLWRLQSPGLLP